MLTSFTRISLAVITDAARLLEIAVLFLKITFPVSVVQKDSINGIVGGGLPSHGGFVPSEHLQLGRLTHLPEAVLQLRQSLGSHTSKHLHGGLVPSIHFLQG